MFYHGESLEGENASNILSEQLNIDSPSTLKLGGIMRTNIFVGNIDSFKVGDYLDLINLNGTRLIKVIKISPRLLDIRYVGRIEWFFVSCWMVTKDAFPFIFEEKV